LAATYNNFHNIVHAGFYANELYNSCASVVGVVVSFIADVIAFCCKLQRCKLLVVSFIVVVTGVLVEIRKSVQLGVCAGLYMYDVVVKSSRSLSQLLSLQLLIK